MQNGSKIYRPLLRLPYLLIVRLRLSMSFQMPKLVNFDSDSRLLEKLLIHDFDIAILIITLTNV